MSIDRDRLEQEAMKLLRKGQTERALERYLALLKLDTRDRRIRQRVACVDYQAGVPIDKRPIQRAVIGDNQVKVLAWSDNEWGFSNRMGEVSTRLI